MTPAMRERLESFADSCHTKANTYAMRDDRVMAETWRLDTVALRAVLAEHAALLAACQAVLKWNDRDYTKSSGSWGLDVVASVEMARAAVAEALEGPKP